MFTLPPMKLTLRLWIPLLLAIAATYCYLDRPLCDYIYEHNWSQYLISLCLHPRWLPHAASMSTDHYGNLITQIIEWPPIITGLSPFLILIGAFLPRGGWRDVLIVTGFSVLFTFVLKNDLKWIFSRDWPLTWTNNNLSWISNHAYGFQWFQGKIFQANDTTGSFPSGHTAVAFAALLPIGLIFPRFLPLCIILATLEGLSMVLFGYHFLSDVLAGAMVGVGCSLISRSIVVADSLTKASNQEEKLHENKCNL
jgi:membrane-associated phospholipid phosphatase